MNGTARTVAGLSKPVDCNNLVPSIALYYAVYKPVLCVLLAGGCCAWMGVVYAYVGILQAIAKEGNKATQLMLNIANTIYIVVITLSILALALPQLAIICDAASMVVFCWSIFTYFRYLRLETGGDASIVELYRNANAKGQPKVCPCFAYIYDQKRQLRAIRIGIFHFPIYHSVVAVVQLSIFILNKELFFSMFYYFLPFIISSIILYVCSSVSYIKSIAPLYPDRPVFKRFFLLQIVLLILKPQIIILEVIYNAITFECSDAGEPKVYMNMLKQSLIIVEVSTVAIFAYHAYTRKEDPEAKEKNVLKDIGGG